MYTATKCYQRRRAPTGLRSETWQPDTDVQLWAIGQMCLVTAGRPRPDHCCSVQAPIPSPSSWSQTCLRGHLSAASTDLRAVGPPTVVRFHLGDFKRISSSRRADTHERGSCVISRPDAACHRARGKDSSRPDNASMFACTKSSHVDRSFRVVTRDSFSTKAPLKKKNKVRNLSYCTTVILPSTTPGCAENVRPGVDGGIFILLPALLYWVIFICGTTHRANVSLEASHNMWNWRRLVSR